MIYEDSDDFVDFDKERRARHREVCAMGGRAVPAAKRSFSLDRELAARAGRKGGQAVKAADRSFSRDRALAARAGAKGGRAVPAAKRTFNDRRLAALAGRKGGAIVRRDGKKSER